MATRTISNTGGNYNATGTWVEGIVPTSADDVVATATSGNLTINVSSAARTFNFTNYVGTLTLNAVWTVSGAALANTFVNAMTCTGTNAILLSGAGASLTSNGCTVSALNLSGSKTLNDNLTVNIFNNSSTGTLTGAVVVTIRTSLNLGANYTLTSATYSFDGTTSITGNAQVHGAVNLNSGTCTLPANGLAVGIASGTTTAGVKITSGSFAGTKLLRVAFQSAGGTFFTDTGSFVWDDVNIQDSLQSAASGIWRLDSDLNFGEMHWYSNHQTNLNTNNSILTLTGNGALKGGLMFTANILAYSGVLGAMTYYGPSELRISVGPSHSVSSFFWNGHPLWQARVRSSATGSQAFLSMSQSALLSSYVNFQDINNTGVTQYNLLGTTNNCTGFSTASSIQSLVSSGVSGGSWTFVN